MEYRTLAHPSVRTHDLKPSSTEGQPLQRLENRRVTTSSECSQGDELEKARCLSDGERRVVIGMKQGTGARVNASQTAPLTNATLPISDIGERSSKYDWSVAVGMNVIKKVKISDHAIEQLMPQADGGLAAVTIDRVVRFSTTTLDAKVSDCRTRVGFARVGGGRRAGPRGGFVLWDDKQWASPIVPGIYDAKGNKSVLPKTVQKLFDDGLSSVLELADGRYYFQGTKSGPNHFWHPSEGSPTLIGYTTRLLSELGQGKVALLEQNRVKIESPTGESIYLRLPETRMLSFSAVLERPNGNFQLVETTGTIREYTAMGKFVDEYTNVNEGPGNPTPISSVHNLPNGCLVVVRGPVVSIWSNDMELVLEKHSHEYITRSAVMNDGTIAVGSGSGSVTFLQPA